MGAILPHLLGFPLVTLANEATNWWEVALPAISGLVGVVVGGLITRWVTLSAEDRRADLERELATAAAMRDEQRAIAERTTLAQAVARVLATRYRQIESHIGTSLNAGVWPPRELEPEPPVPYEDRKLLASIMSSSDLSVLDRAEHSARAMFAMRDHIVGSTSVAIPPITGQHDLHALTQARQDADAADAVLRQFAP